MAWRTLERRTEGEKAEERVQGVPVRGARNMQGAHRKGKGGEKAEERTGGSAVGGVTNPGRERNGKEKDLRSAPQKHAGRPNKSPLNEVNVFLSPFCVSL